MSQSGAPRLAGSPQLHGGCCCWDGAEVLGWGASTEPRPPASCDSREPTRSLTAFSSTSSEKSSISSRGSEAPAAILR